MKKTFLLFVLSLILFSCSKQGKKTQEKGKSGIIGTVVYQGIGVNWAYAYVYPTENTNFRQEFTQVSEATGTPGTFTIYVKPGKYYLVARKRWNYAKVGPLRTGDFDASYFNNPIIVKENQFTEIGQIELNEIREERDKIPEGSGIKGKVIIDDKKIDDVFVYIYNNDDSQLRGPSYYLTKPVKDDGSFKINLLPGTYFLVARKRKSGSKLGPLDEGDFNSIYEKNPINVIKNEYFDAGELYLKKIDSQKLNDIKKGDIASNKNLTTVIKGFITNKKGEKIKNIYAFVYKDYQMVGKPLSRSLATQKDGKYEIFLKEGGIYYIGARNTFGGPLEPGDLVGSYNGTQDHLVKLKNGETLENINIVIEEFQ
ncbi:MAG: hypothetical protein HY934_09800 [Candidatus Firestonebacteria bacterium]|nr:hypothetical protein [Candidatus Firestonebacteria bacterium]